MKKMYKILVVSLPLSSKRALMSERLSSQNLSWEWIDGVIIPSMNDIPLEERNNLEAYKIPHLKNDPRYVLKAIGCKRAMQKAITYAANRQEDWVVILQDDVHPVPEFAQKLSRLLESVPVEAGAVMLRRSGGGVTQINGWLQVTGNVRSMSAFAVRPAFAPVMSQFLATWGGEDDRIWEPLARLGHVILSPVPMLAACTQKNSDIISGIPELSPPGHTDRTPVPQAILNSKSGPADFPFHINVRHPAWSDTLIMESADRAFRQSNHDGARVLSFDTQHLQLKWDRWGMELFTRIKDGRYMQNDLPATPPQKTSIHTLQVNAENAAREEHSARHRSDLVFSSFWHNESDMLPDLAVCSMKSFLSKGYPFTLFCYKPFRNVPEGVQIVNANEILDQSNLYIHQSGSLAPFSDVFRLKMIAQYDTVWTDLDNLCLKDTFPEKDSLFYKENGRIVIPFFYFGKTARARQIMDDLQTVIDHPEEFMPWDSPALRSFKTHIRQYKTLREKRIRAEWCFFGSELFTCLGRYYHFLDDAFDFRRHINPYHFSQIYKLYVFPESEAMHAKMKNVHLLALSSDLLRREPYILQNMRPDSFVARLLETFR